MDQDAEIARRDELMVRDLEEIRRQAAEIAALREGIGLLTTLAPDVDCGLPITELCWAVHKAVTAEISALREKVLTYQPHPGEVKFTTEEFDAQIRMAEERGREESSSEIAALREAVRMVLDYEQGIGVFDFSGRSAYERQNAAFDAWLEVRERMVRALEDGR